MQRIFKNISFKIIGMYNVDSAFATVEECFLSSLYAAEKAGRFQDFS